MKYLKYIFAILSLTSICIYGGTYLTDLFTYTQSNHAYEDVYAQLQETLKPICEQGILNENDLKTIIGLDDIKSKTSTEKITQRSNDYLIQRLKEQQYRLDEERIHKITTSISTIYEQYIPHVDTPGIVNITRIYSLVIFVISSISFLFFLFITKRRQR